MTPGADAARRRVRLYVDTWLATYGGEGFLPRLGNLPSLDIADLVMVLEEAEGPHEWAAVAWYDPGDGIYLANEIATFLTREQALAYVRASDVPGIRLARWDDNGYKSGWRGAS